MKYAAALPNSLKLASWNWLVIASGVGSSGATWGGGGGEEGRTHHTRPPHPIRVIIQKIAARVPNQSVTSQSTIQFDN